MTHELLLLIHQAVPREEATGTSCALTPPAETEPATWSAGFGFSDVSCRPTMSQRPQQQRTTWDREAISSIINRSDRISVSQIFILLL